VSKSRTSASRAVTTARTPTSTFGLSTPPEVACRVTLEPGATSTAYDPSGAVAVVPSVWPWPSRISTVSPADAGDTAPERPTASPKSTTLASATRVTEVAARGPVVSLAVAENVKPPNDTDTTTASTPARAIMHGSSAFAAGNFRAVRRGPLDEPGVPSGA